MSQIDPDGIRRRIRQARLEVGLTQQELADLLEVHKRTVENYENIRVPDFKGLNRLAPVLRVSVEWLLHGTTQPEEGRDVEEIVEHLAEMERRLEERERHLDDRLDRIERLLRGEGSQGSSP